MHFALDTALWKGALMRKLFVVVLVGWLAGCHAPLTAWQDEPIRARGGFMLSSGVITTDTSLADSTFNEVSGQFRHTPQFEMEYGVGFWILPGEAGSSSRLICPYSTIAGFYTHVKDNMVIRIGGGLDFAVPESRVGAEDQEYAYTQYNFSVFDIELDPAMGYHAQFDACYQFDNGFKLGVLLRRTMLETGETFHLYDGTAHFILRDTISLNNTMTGIYFGATF